MATFKANRSDPELVAPALPTPREHKALSDVDTQRMLCFYATGVEFFRRHPIDGREPEDPAKAVKAALEKALVYYYPMAGRLRELPGEKLVVDCTGEGVVFVEADADVRLDELGEPLVPPYPCVEEFVCDPGDTKVVLGKPLIFMQVTRLKCGGFVIGTHSCHNMVDAFGVIQFLKAVADIARGDENPTVLPVWERQLLTARNPPNVAHLHLSLLDGIPIGSAKTQSLEGMVGEYFFFGPRELAALESHLPLHLHKSSTAFELITAAMWKCRTAALGYAPGQRASLLINMNARGKWKRDPPLPRGFYGNGFVYLVVDAAASELCGGSLGYAVELVRKAKLDMTDEFTKAMVDLIVLRGGPPYAPGWTYVVSNITRIGEDALHLGWAERVAGGVPMVGDPMSKILSYQMRCKDADGEDCVVVPMFLPKPAMARFAEMIFVLSN